MVELDGGDKGEHNGVGFARMFRSFALQNTISFATDPPGGVYLCQLETCSVTCVSHIYFGGKILYYTDYFYHALKWPSSLSYCIQYIYMFATQLNKFLINRV